MKFTFAVLTLLLFITATSIIMTSWLTTNKNFDLKALGILTDAKRFKSYEVNEDFVNSRPKADVRFEADAIESDAESEVKSVKAEEDVSKSEHMPIVKKRLDSRHEDKSQFDEIEALDYISKKLLKNPAYRSKIYLDKLIFAAKTLNQTRVNFTPTKIFRAIENARPVELTSEEIETLSAIKGRTGGNKQTRPQYSGLFRENDEKLFPWQMFHKRINQYEFYNDDDNLIDRLLKDMAQLPITNCGVKDRGTQLKLNMTLKDDNKALLKPMRFPREMAETWPDHYYFSDFERHNAEIASFHLDRLLRFHRVPPTTGRYVNVIKDIKQYADSQFLRTFFISPAGNVCFFGECSYFCDSAHAFCGHPELMEGSMMILIHPAINRLRIRHPWRRSYSRTKKADWETDDKYCDKVRSEAPYDTGRRLLDLMDMAVFDFLTGNLDRHHYETISDFGHFTFTIHLDNGRAFGKPLYDDMSILAPITQCCLFRYSTLQTLLKFNNGPVKLSDAMRKSLEKDVLPQVLLEPHLLALDRRVKIILKTVYKCIKEKKFVMHVVIDDGF